MLYTYLQRKMTQNTDKSEHSFYIPVMGTAFTIDSPIKTARFGISSVISMCDDELCETMGLHYSALFNKPYTTIDKSDDDFRAKRITAYLNLVSDILSDQIAEMKAQSFDDDNDLVKYFDLLPDNSDSARLYKKMKETSDQEEKKSLQDELRTKVIPGSIDVNIMTKLDRDTFSHTNNEPLGSAFSDSCAAFRGFAKSKLSSSMVFSAGFNRRLYAYIENYSDFYPDESGKLKKKIVLKVSDFRSALTQGKFLAKKGIWVSEYRIESGLNCGGHAFATDGFLLGPILEEFKQKRHELSASLLEICNESLAKKSVTQFKSEPEHKVTVQGGIGTGKEHDFLLSHYQVNEAGWASPFLLVEEATTLDDETRALLVKAKHKDFYLSGVSPLGVPFNTVRGTQSEQQKLQRYADGKPGSPCPKGHLISNKEYSKKFVCTASVFFQKRKLAEIESFGLPADQLEIEKMKVIDKVCLCEDLAAGALIVNGLSNKRPLKTAVCPGPNLANFTKLSSLKEMVNHIYDRINLLTDAPRSNMFISELKMYIDYLSKDIQTFISSPSDRQLKKINEFKVNLFEGMDYYKTLIPNLAQESAAYREIMAQELSEQYDSLQAIFAKHQNDLVPVSA